MSCRLPSSRKRLGCGGVLCAGLDSKSTRLPQLLLEGGVLLQSISGKGCAKRCGSVWSVGTGHTSPMPMRTDCAGLG